MLVRRPCSLLARWGGRRCAGEDRQAHPRSGRPIVACIDPGCPKIRNARRRIPPLLSRASQFLPHHPRPARQQPQHRPPHRPSRVRLRMRSTTTKRQSMSLRMRSTTTKRQSTRPPAAATISSWGRMRRTMKSVAQPPPARAASAMMRSRTRLHHQAAPMPSHERARMRSRRHRRRSCAGWCVPARRRSRRRSRRPRRSTLMSAGSQVACLPSKLGSPPPCATRPTD